MLLVGEAGGGGALSGPAGWICGGGEEKGSRAVLFCHSAVKCFSSLVVVRVCLCACMCVLMCLCVCA